MPSLRERERDPGRRRMGGELRVELKHSRLRCVPGRLRPGSRAAGHATGPLVAVIEAVLGDKDLERMWKKKSDAESGEERESGDHCVQRR